MQLRNRGTCVRVLVACALMAAGGRCAYAQAQQGPEQQAVVDAKAARAHEPLIRETIFLKNVTVQYDLNDIQTALRNNFPWAKMYGLAGQNAITVTSTAEDLQDIKKMVAELDRPKNLYRLTYSVSDVENGKKTGTQHYSLVVAAGSKGILREGKRIPMVTGAAGESGAQNTQVQYIDVGVSIDASIEGEGLKTKVELTAVADEKSTVATQDPVIQQTMLENNSSLTMGKPMVLGSLEVPGTARRQEIEVTTELLTQ
jgi:type II secretory pathway component GspD/PulD (secretin)